MSISYSYKVSAARISSQAREDGRTEVTKQITVTVTGTDGQAKLDLPVVVNIAEIAQGGFAPLVKLTGDEMLAWALGSPAIADARAQVELALSSGSLAEYAP